MPEGHTLHRLAAQINTVFVGSPWRVSSPQGRFAAGAERLDGQVPQHAEAWGKHLFVHLGPEVWQVHLGLYGAFSFRGDQEFTAEATIGAPRAAAVTFEPQYDDDGWLIPEPAQGAVRARVSARHGWADLRGPATCAVLEVADYHKIIARLGPDPLRQGPPDRMSTDQGHAGSAQTDRAQKDQHPRETFLRNLSRRRISIAAALMDQAVIAGVGNIYRAESLFLEQLDPHTPSNQIDPERATALWDRLTEQLRDGVAEGRIRTVRTGGSRRHWVYKHQGTACPRCGAVIEAAELQGRRLYWCPGCQRG
ncbi:Fpg/Nei family DNA glycosylase [Nesterenkonia sp. LB17]|uniref:Fpg/Nei family DNA glycosylase n=1 Tax=unclassified Nesterenkonia TaxID=2629769 RepID=UPI001F4C6AE4|nr:MULTISPECIES: DNA-formamidopyrimidine glycosylase family protein [unclassified Nesterenkonia]MCH8561329.1 Fpg/Nei family DNA glycosylase [Nesterenkonia sp. DZ6]MCH8565293.1 Fpg/Nei family DNA glycosylase [Nesterenkonia sp. LB17]